MADIRVLTANTLALSTTANPPGRVLHLGYRPITTASSSTQALGLARAASVPATSSVPSEPSVLEVINSILLLNILLLSYGYR